VEDVLSNRQKHICHYASFLNHNQVIITNSAERYGTRVRCLMRPPSGSPEYGIKRYYTQVDDYSLLRARS